MKAVRLTAIGQLTLAEVDRPIARRGEVLIRVEAAGVCGSDRHMVKGEYPTALPVTLGHEFCGIIEAMGEGATRLQPGDRVTVDPNIACGTCPACRAGKPNLCDTLTAIGVFRDGGFAEYVAVPEAQAYLLPPGLDPRHGAFSEPLACCLHALDLAEIRPGMSVAILGGGVIGLLMVQLARLAGATTVILSTRQQPRRELALATGATHAVPPDTVETVLPAGVDVVIECAGVPETFAQALRLAKKGGTVVIFGVTPKGTTVQVEPFDLLVREIRLVSAWLNPMTHARAADLVASGTLQLDPLISQVITLGQLPAILAAAPAFGEVKTIITPGGA